MSVVNDEMRTIVEETFNGVINYENVIFLSYFVCKNLKEMDPNLKHCIKNQILVLPVSFFVLVVYLSIMQSAVMTSQILNLTKSYWQKNKLIILT